MNATQRKTLNAIFEHPTRTSILWTDIENLLKALGAIVMEGNGSRVRVVLRGATATFHRPHPRRDSDVPSSPPTQRSERGHD